MNEVVKKPPARGMAEGLMRLLVDPNIATDKLELLLKMQNETLAQQAREDFHQAFNELSKDLPQVDKRGVVELRSRDDRRLGGYSYTKWEDMDRAIRPKLTQHGFGLSFSTFTDAAGHAAVRAKLMHNGGHFEVAELPLIFDKGPGRNELQAMGSGISYTKRYLAELLLNIVRRGEDDDAITALSRKLSPAQVAALAAKISEAKTTPEKFLSIMVTEAKTLEEVPDREYERLITACNATIARNKKREQKS